MKKIMFNDKYGLTDAVLNGQKTMTRRIVKNPNLLQWLNELDDDGAIRSVKGKILSEENSAYKVGEIVAVAQKYFDLRNCDAFYEALSKADPYFPLECIKGEKGAYNKMFVKAEWMPNRIRITEIKVERLQDISEEDCLREGIMMEPTTGWYYVPNLYLHRKKKNTVWPTLFESPKAAYCSLCKILGMVLDNSANPWVFAYTFELERRHT